MPLLRKRLTLASERSLAVAHDRTNSVLQQVLSSWLLNALVLLPNSHYLSLLLAEKKMAPREAKWCLFRRDDFGSERFVIERLCVKMMMLVVVLVLVD
jgi:hypothetical protein